MSDEKPRGGRNDPGAGPRVCLLFGSFRGGGVGRTMLRAAQGFLARGCAVDLVVGRRRGDLLGEVPAGARVVVLKRSAKLTTPGVRRRGRPRRLEGTGGAHPARPHAAGEAALPARARSLLPR